MLTNIDLKNTYSSGLDEPREFFIEALIESKKFDLGLGYFSSSGIRSLSYGFALFIANNGKMRVIINDILSLSDKNAIENGLSNKINDFEEKLLKDFNRLTETLSKADEQFYRCFSYLISTNRIEFVAAISAKGGLAHDKYGIFTDERGNKVAFIGSTNFSKTALEFNSETITVFSSWREPYRVEEYQNLFDISWQGNDSRLIHIPFDRVKTKITEKYPITSLNDLIEFGNHLRENDNFIDNKPISEDLLKKIHQKEQEPRFPFPEERSIQKEAYAAWVKNDKKGIFAMATGSGKTITALNCVLKSYQEEGYYKTIIVVPTQALALQWEQEAKNFNFQNIISTHTNKNWKEDLLRYSTISNVNPNRNIVIITTYATFNRGDFQSFVLNTKGIESFIYIADEAHNIGAKNTLKYLPKNIEQRIGLSATPERIYDEGGSKELYDFFNSTAPNYTYRFTMKQAIEQDILCHYDYHPIFVELTQDEIEEYKEITVKLQKFIDAETGKYKKDAEMLLLQRKRIIHKAKNKKKKIAALLEDLKQKHSLNYTFVFVPEGYEPNYTEIDDYQIQEEDVHIIDEYAQMFKEQGYRYHKYIGGLKDSEQVLKNFENGDIQVLLSMKCLDEGVDIPRAEYAIFCSSTGNPRQFVQRRGRVLRKHKDKDKAAIWDLVVIPPNISEDMSSAERNIFLSEIKRVVNFAALADNEISIIYGELSGLCDTLRINLFEILEQEQQKYD